VCVFDGIVRDNTRGRKTLYLDYEAYREMALEQMQRLARRRWNGLGCGMWRWCIGWAG
jgi:molybdopterin synthase catalytic subunit